MREIQPYIWASVRQTQSAVPQNQRHDFKDSKYSLFTSIQTVHPQIMIHNHNALLERCAVEAQADSPLSVPLSESYSVGLQQHLMVAGNSLNRSVENEMIWPCWSDSSDWEGGLDWQYTLYVQLLWKSTRKSFAAVRRKQNNQIADIKKEQWLFDGWLIKSNRNSTGAEESHNYVTVWGS